MGASRLRVKHHGALKGAAGVVTTLHAGRVGNLFFNLRHGRKNFLFFEYVQTGFRLHPASVSVGTGGSFRVGVTAKFHASICLCGVHRTSDQLVAETST